MDDDNSVVNADDQYSKDNINGGGGVDESGGPKEEQNGRSQQQETSQLGEAPLFTHVDLAEKKKQAERRVGFDERSSRICLKVAPSFKVTWWETALAIHDPSSLRLTPVMLAHLGAARLLLSTIPEPLPRTPPSSGTNFPLLSS
jgi:hypothetical protein